MPLIPSGAQMTPPFPQQPHTVLQGCPGLPGPPPTFCFVCVPLLSVLSSPLPFKAPSQSFPSSPISVHWKYLGP